MDKVFNIVKVEQENVRLKELNREMVEAMKANCEICVKDRDLDLCKNCVYDKYVNKSMEVGKMREKHSKPVEYMDILFAVNKDKPPCTLEFVEVENEHGESVSVGEWIDEGYYTRLRIPLLAKTEGEGE